MGKKYTRKEILKKCEEAFKNISTFYNSEPVEYKYTGRTLDTKEPYSEVVAEFLCERIEEFLDGITKINRESSYSVKGHDGTYNPDSNRLEEIIAMQIFNQCKNGSSLDFIGKVIDYQTPLKNARANSAGKIDLLSINDRTVYILELKKEDSTETMLRCVLEGYTYLKTVNSEKLLKDFGLPSDCEIKACPLVFRGGTQWKEMQEERLALKQLMRMLNSKPFYLSEKDGKYIVTEE
ncbi:MAG: hypothetical protein J1F22_06990 [Lachnospiraceae bacterium]|nr:hypothetical protein [Lachnospiraceae bacterium]